jgi:phage-related protein/predicted XRE-type DNA-binding protein
LRHNRRKTRLLGWVIQIRSAQFSCGRREVGYALGVAQLGIKHPAAKPSKGEGAGVFGVVERHEGNAYRAVYTLRFENFVYVLHVFHKKSPSGIRTAQADIDLVGARLNAARAHFELNHQSGRRARQANMTTAIIKGTGNVFADLGLPNPAGRQTTTRLAMALNAIIKNRRLKQAETAALLGISQPAVSELANYRLDHVSADG